MTVPTVTCMWGTLQTHGNPQLYIISRAQNIPNPLSKMSRAVFPRSPNKGGVFAIVNLQSQKESTEGV